MRHRPTTRHRPRTAATAPTAHPRPPAAKTPRTPTRPDCLRSGRSWSKHVVITTCFDTKVNPPRPYPSRAPVARAQHVTMHVHVAMHVHASLHGCGSGLDQAGDGGGGLAHLFLGLRATLLDGLGDTVPEVVLEQAQRDRLQGPGHR